MSAQLANLTGADSAFLVVLYGSLVAVGAAILRSLR